MEETDSTWDYIKQVQIDETKEDVIVWRTNVSEVYSVKSAWQEFRRKDPTVSWLWGKWHIPRYSFFAYLAIYNRLPIKTTLAR